MKEQDAGGSEKFREVARFISRNALARDPSNALRYRTQNPDIIRISGINVHIRPIR